MIYDIDQVLSYIQKDSVHFREDYLRTLMLLASRVPQGGIILEIGCYRGDSLVAMTAGSHPSVNIISVDPIFKEGTITYPDANQPSITLSSDMEAVLARVNGICKRNVQVWPLTSMEAYGAFGSPVDFLFVDGEHTYDAVLQDCRWLDRVKPGGFAAFDDWMAPIEKAVRTFIADRPEWQIVYESTTPPRDGVCITLLQKS